MLFVQCSDNSKLSIVFPEKATEESFSLFSLHFIACNNRRG